MDTETKISLFETERIKEEKKKALAAQIIENCRNELYSQYPYLAGAFAALHTRYGGETVSVDGENVQVNPTFFIRIYAENPGKIKRGYLHMLLHCLYLHILPPYQPGGEHTVLMSPEMRRLWNLACDIAVETIIDGRKEGALNAEKEFENLLTQKYEGSLNLEALEEKYQFDDHTVWYRKMTEDKIEGLRGKWGNLLGRAMNQQGRQRGSQRGFRSEKIGEIRKGKYDYRKYLKRFAIAREEVELDPDSFDYIPYDYGMRYYGNLPFVEPLEYREVHRLEELVIAIDTSSSCSRETVQRFLDETYAILCEKENFFRRFKVYLIQCDCFLQDVTALHTEEEWKEYRKNVTIQGRSGTDFRPVFDEIEKLRSQKELRNLKALIYFTDGDGIYPQNAVDYETAFVFLEKNDHIEKVPGWASVLVADLKGEGKNEY